MKIKKVLFLLVILHGGIVFAALGESGCPGNNRTEQPPVYWTGLDGPAAFGVFYIDSCALGKDTLTAPEARTAACPPVYYTGNNEPIACQVFWYNDPRAL